MRRRLNPLNTLLVTVIEEVVAPLVAEMGELDLAENTLRSATCQLLLNRFWNLQAVGKHLNRPAHTVARYFEGRLSEPGEHLAAGALQAVVSRQNLTDEQALELMARLLPVNQSRSDLYDLIQLWIQSGALVKTTHECERFHRTLLSGMPYRQPGANTTSLIRLLRRVLVESLHDEPRLLRLTGLLTVEAQDLLLAEVRDFAAKRFAELLAECDGNPNAEIRTVAVVAGRE
jgi:hypothetical protein